MASRAGRAALIAGSVALIGGGATAAVILLPRKPSPSSATSDQVSMTVQGYSLASAPSTFRPTLSAASGDSLIGTITVANLTASALAVGARAWLILAGQDTSIPQYLHGVASVTGEAVLPESGTIEGHLFSAQESNQAQAQAGEPGDLVAQVQLGAAGSPQASQTLAMYSGPLFPTGTTIAGLAPGQALGVLWAVGPFAAVAALPAGGGTLLPGNSVAYLFDAGVVGEA